MGESTTLSRDVRYPFVPKSNRYLRPGQFWALPLSAGRFSPGRVLAVPAFGPRDRPGVVIGLVDWVGSQPPGDADIGDRGMLVQAKSRYEAISKTGGAVLGWRDLELDGIRVVDPEDTTIGTSHLVWGWATILKRAEKQFG
jgi:hypothetical protein